MDRRKGFENAVCGHGFFRKTGEKKLCFQKYPDTCGRGALTLKTEHPLTSIQ